MRFKRKKLLALLLTAAMVLSQPVMCAFADEVKTEATAEVTGDSAETAILKADSDKAKMTLMLYVVGSDLERNSFFGTYDLIEILAGMKAAANYYGKENISVNIIAETGGVSYDKKFNDDKKITRTDKVYNRAKARWESITSRKETLETYEKEAKNLSQDEDFTFDAVKYFKDLTRDDAEMPDPDEFDDNYPGERIDWEKNQRWELSFDDLDEDHPCITSATNAVSKENERRSLLEEDEDGVTTELYDFVYSTMEAYPADQYALVLWDHGGGAVDGFGSDERDMTEEVPSAEDYKAVTSYNIKKTFDALEKNMGNKWQDFAFAGYDACLMGDINTLSAWEDYTDYLIGSEDLEPGQGWYYTPAIFQLCACAASTDPVFDFNNKDHVEAISEEVGKTVVSTTIDWFRNEHNRATLGIFDLRENSDGLKNLKEAVSSFSGAVKDYIMDDPTDAYPAIYNAHNDGVVFNSNAIEDMRLFTDNLSVEVRDDEPETGSVKYKVEDTAINLYNVMDNAKEGKFGPTISQNNTGLYEGQQVFEHGGSGMGGISWYFPDGDNNNINWSNYLDLYIDKLGNKTDPYHDMAGAYVAIQYGGKDAMVKIYTGDLTEEEGAESFQASMNKALEAYGVSDDVKEALKDAAAAFVEKRITPEDTKVVLGEDGKWYSKIENDAFADRFNNKAYIYYTDEDYVNLGELPGATLSEEGEIIIGDPEAKDWIYFGDEKNTYPAYVFDSELYDSDDAMKGELFIKIPAIIVGEGDGKQKNCLMNVYFGNGENKGEIESYQIYDFSDPFSTVNRTTNKSAFTGNEYVVPLYNCETEAESFYDNNGDVVLPVIKLKDAEFTRGEEPEGALAGMAKSMKNWEKASEDGVSLRLDVSFTLKDVFGNYYELYRDEEAEEEEVSEDKDGEPLSKIVTKEDIAAIEGDMPTVSKNEILSKIDAAIDSMVKEKKTVSFNEAIKGSGKNADKEYWVQISMNRALRYDGRNHAFNSDGKSSKSKNEDIEVKVYYCEKAGEYAMSAPSANGWKEAKVKKAVIKNAKNALFDYAGNKLGSVKGYSKAPYLSGIVLEDKELNKALGKALNKELKNLAKKLKSDKSSSYTDGDLDLVTADLEKKLIIPVYPLFAGVSGNSAKYTDGNLKSNDITVEKGSFDSAKKKLKDAKVSIKYADGAAKDIKMKYNSRKDKDFMHEVKEVKAADGSTKTQLAATGNFFGFLEY